MKMCGDANCENVADGLLVVCVIAPLKEVTHDVVLPIHVVTDLQHLPVLNVMSVSVFTSDVTGVAVGETCDNSNDDNDVLNADQLPAGDCVSSDTGLRELQEKDDSLSACWEMAKAGKGDCIIDDGLLYHID